jgi:hypothetical protein
MWKRRAATLWCSLAAVPLIGCVGAATTASRQVPPTPSTLAAEPASARLYPAGDAAPTAILVVLPGAGVLGSDPALWRSQGLDIVLPPPTALYRLASEQEETIAQMLTSARRLAEAPIWLIGPSNEIDAALRGPYLGAEVSGVVETMSGVPAGTCSESFSYFDPGTGAKPQVKFSQSGDCPPDAGFGIGGRNFAPVAPTAPAIRPNAPRVIEASVSPATASPAARRAAVEHLAELIKAAPSS